LDEGPCNIGESQYELVVEIGNAQEALKLSECSWGWLVMDDLDFGWIHTYSMMINDASHVINLVHAEGEFFQVGVELVFLQGVQNLLNMLQVFCPSLIVNEDVIQIQHYKCIGEWSLDIIHHPHVSGWCICQTKGHEQPFKKTFH
jgi:hypothetical protein